MVMRQTISTSGFMCLMFMRIKPQSFKPTELYKLLKTNHYVFEFNASDPDGDQLIYSILYGEDAYLFELNSITDY